MADEEQPPPGTFSADIARLTSFLDDVERVLADALDSRPYLFDGHITQLRAAWPEVQAKFVTARDGLAAGETGNAFEHFRLHGLTGTELDLKLELFGSAKEAYEQRAREAEDAERFLSGLFGLTRGIRVVAGGVRRAGDGLMRPVRRAARGGLGRMLRIADVPLGSLGKALDAAFRTTPGVGIVYGAAVEGIDEFKRAAEYAVERLDEPDR